MGRNIWKDGIMGVIVGDALGMPVQFRTRTEVRKNPITTMVGYGTFYKPAGTWSDDGSMTYAALASIVENKGIDYDDIMRRFIAWDRDGEYTQDGVSFDQGYTCMLAIDNYEVTGNYKTCGKTGEYANGNGALMRIMPFCLYAYIQHKKGAITLTEALEYVHQATALTHNHLRAKIASGIYFFMVQAILDENEILFHKLRHGIENAKQFYMADSANLKEWQYYSRMEDLVEFAALTDDNIRSSGYVVDSLEAAVWALICSDTFEEGLLKAVNLGDDTDTVGAIAGGIAALHYGYENIPETWRNAIFKGEGIIELCEQAEVIL